MHRWHSGASALVCGAYCGVTAYLLSRQGLPDFVWALAVAGAVVGVALSRSPLGRDVLRAVAALECVVAVLAFRVFVKSLRSDLFPDLAYYILCGVTLPALVVAFASYSKPSPAEDELPAAYEYLARATAPTPAWQKLALVVLVSAVLFAPMISMLLFWSVLVLPVGFAVYFVVGILRNRRAPIPTVARRIVIPSQRERPVQPRSHWTVISNDGENRGE